MQVRDIMVQEPVCCHAETTLFEATALLWERNCGALPVIDGLGKVTAILTDRDICIALGTRNKRASELTVGEVVTEKVYVCRPDDDIHLALRSMETHRVRRLPVVDEQGHLSGIVSLDDIAVNAQWSETRPVDLKFVDVMRTLKRVSYPAKPCAGAQAAGWNC
jgi:CBS domain-containing protein